MALSAGLPALLSQGQAQLMLRRRWLVMQVPLTPARSAEAGFAIAFHYRNDCSYGKEVGSRGWVAECEVFRRTWHWRDRGMPADQSNVPNVGISRPPATLSEAEGERSGSAACRVGRRAYLLGLLIRSYMA